MFRITHLALVGMLLFCGTLWGEEEVPAGMKVPAPGRVQGQRLLLPEVEGYVDAPGQGWVWYEQAIGTPKGVTMFYSLNREASGAMVVSLEPMVGFLSEKTIGRFMAGVREGSAKQGGKILAERCAPVAVPNHENVYRIALHMELPNGESLWTVGYAFSTGAYQIMLSYLAQDDQEPQGFKDFCAGLRFRKVVPSESGSQGVRDGLAFALAVGYLIWGCLVGGVVLLANKFAKRQLASPAKAGLIAIFALLVLRLCINGLTPHATATGEVSVAYQQGQEIGYALFPLIILGFVYRDERKKERARAAQKTSIPPSGAPPGTGDAPRKPPPAT